MTVLVMGVLAAVMLVLLFATFLIWIPLVAFFVVGVIVAGMLRAFRRAP